MHQDDPSITRLTGREIVSEVTAGRLTPEAVISAFIARTQVLEPGLGTYVKFAPEAALAEARAVATRLQAGEDLPLAGLPVSIKDQFRVSGMPCTGGSRIFENFIPEDDAVLVSRLRAAGAIITGKTVTPEFGVFWRAGAQVGQETRNPWDRERTSGGSSAGSAAGVAARLTPVSIGADGGGSIRLPSAFCGIAGLIPTLGRIARTGSFDGARLFTQAGPMARNVEDLSMLLDVLHGPDVGDVLSTTCPPIAPVTEPGRPLRLAFWDAPGPMASDHDPRVLELVRVAANKLAAEGHQLTPLDPPIDTQAILPNFRIISGSDRLAFLGADLLADPTRAALLGPYARETFETARSFSAVDYARAQDHRERTIAALNARFADADLILSPTAGTTAPVIPDHPSWRPPGYFAYTFVANYTGFPALSIPCGLLDGLPVGLQIMAPPGGEALLLHVGLQAERIFGRFDPIPDDVE